MKCFFSEFHESPQSISCSSYTAPAPSKTHIFITHIKLLPNRPYFNEIYYTTLLHREIVFSNIIIWLNRDQLAYCKNKLKFAINCFKRYK